MLLALFAALCALEAYAGWLLWNGERLGALMTVGLLPIEVVVWAGFAVPIPPLFAIARLGLLAAGWSAVSYRVGAEPDRPRELKVRDDAVISDSKSRIGHTLLPCGADRSQLLAWCQ